MVPYTWTHIDFPILMWNWQLGTALPRLIIFLRRKSKEWNQKSSIQRAKINKARAHVANGEQQNGQMQIKRGGKQRDLSPFNPQAWRKRW